jgi:4-hydroxybenzoate polyprenyltransferase
MKTWRLHQYVVFSNVWVALGCAALSSESLFLLNQCFDVLIFAQMFTGAFVVYNLQRLVKSKQYAPQSEAARFTHEFKKPIAVVMALCTIFLLLTPWPVSSNWLLLAFSLLMLSALYVIRLFPLNNERRSLRELPLVKVFVVSAVWAVSTTVLPVMLANTTVSMDLRWMVIERWFFLMAITIPFDIRDMLVDDPTCKTLPQWVGINKAKWVAAFFLVAMFLVNFLRLNAGYIREGVFLALLLVGLLSLFLIHRSKPDTDDMLFAGWLDGTMFLRGVLVLLAVVSEVQRFFEC